MASTMSNQSAATTQATGNSSPANYAREIFHSTITYKVTSTPAPPQKALSGSTRIVAASAGLLSVYLGWIVRLSPSSGTAFSLFLIICGISLLILAIGASVFPARQDPEIVGQRADVCFAVEAAGLRIGDRVFDPDAIDYIRVGNTFADSTNPRALALGDGMVAFAIASASKSERALAAVCYYIAIHHEKKSFVLADGLDNSTARSLYRDLCKDLRYV